MRVLRLLMSWGVIRDGGRRAATIPSRDGHGGIVTIVTERWGGQNLGRTLFLTTSDELGCHSVWWSLGRHQPLSR